jgi:putative ABC transport system permease protein
MSSILRELALAARRLVRSPGFTGLVLLILALTIGADTAVFSLVDAVLLRPLPYGDPDRLVAVFEDHSRLGGEARMSIAPPTLRDFGGNHAFSGVASQLVTPLSLTGDGDPESLRSARVSTDYFDVLRVKPLLGRAFQPDEGQAHSAVLSYALWQRRFGGDRRILGRTLTLDGEGYVVVGVMPRDFAVPLFLRAPRESLELWVPWQARPEDDIHSLRILQGIGRLAPGAGLTEARAEVEATARRLEAEHPESNASVGATLVPLREQIFGDLRKPVLVLLCGALLVLLVTGANVAGLLLARGLARDRELAVLGALGASRSRLAGQVLAESLLLWLAGGVAGLLVALWGIRLLVGLLPADVPHLTDVRLDGSVVFWALAAALLAGLLCALAPAVRAAVCDLGRALGGSRGTPGGARGVTRGALVAGQIALTLVLLLGAGLLLRSFRSLTRVDPGFRPAGVLIFRMTLAGDRYADDAAQTAFFTELFHRLEALPGVVSAGGSTRLPLDPAYGSGAIKFEGKPVPQGQEPTIGVSVVSPGYFRTLSVPQIAGRPLSERDDTRSPSVVLVNAAFARRFWPGENAVGKRLSIGREATTWREVVGVVGDVAHDSLAAERQPAIYVPYTQNSTRGFQVVVRTAGDPMTVVGPARREIAALDPSLPLVDVAPLSRHVDEALARPRFSLSLVGLFAALTLALSALGIFGLVSYNAAQRTWEAGVRVALGADRGKVLRMFVEEALRLTAAGLVLGLIGGWMATRWLSGQLFGVSATDPVTFLGSALLLAAVALLAGWLPARRAARLDPATALRRA